MMAHNAKQDQDNGAYPAYHKILVHKFPYHASRFQGGGELGPNSGDCWLSSWFGSATVLGFAYCAYKRFFRKLSFSKKRISTSVDQEALFNFTGSKCPFSASLNESTAAPGLRGWRRVRRLPFTHQSAAPRLGAHFCAQLRHLRRRSNHTQTFRYSAAPDWMGLSVFKSRRAVLILFVLPST